MTTVIATLPINRAEDVFALRQSGRAATAALGCDEADQVRFATALSEVGREVLVHKSASAATFSLLSGGVLQVEIKDFPRAGAGAGSGLEAAAKLVENIRTENEDEKNKTLTVVLRRNPAPRAEKIETRRIREAVLHAAPPQPLDELRLENRDLIATLNELRDRQEQLVQLNAELEETNRGVMAMYTQLAGELEETNRGVVALYAELDDKSARLNEANQAKSRFLASVSHELRSPVNSVLALLRLVLDPQGDPLTVEQRKQLSLTLNSAAELLQLVNGLLDLAKAESGRLEPDVSVFNLSEVFSELRGSLRPLARPGVNFVCEAPEDISIQTDRLLFTQVIRNLATNALKFTTTGSVVVRVSLPAPYEVAIDVVDTGIGIAPEHQQKVFEEFFQVRGPLHIDNKGSGLGLPYAKRVVQELGGSIRLQSAEAVGSTFSVRLPLVFQTLLSAPESPGRLARSMVSVDKVLIVDDDEGFRTALRGMLQGIARQVLEARAGREGLELMRETHPDIAFIDLRMPDIDGSEVLAEMNADPALRDISAIIITSTELNAGNRATLGSASALMGKSELSKERLFSVIAQALEKTSAVR